MLLDSQSFKQKKKVCFLSTFYPRKCGIAVFTKDLVDQLDMLDGFDPAKVIAVNKGEPVDSYNQNVEWQIRQDEEMDYIQIANQVNLLKIDLINVQHEFGIFGGEWGNYILSFLERVKKPVVTTLHTVQPDFEPEKLMVLERIVTRSKAIIVMGSSAAKIIAQYGIPTEKIRVVQHGCPDVPFTFSDNVKPSLDLKGRTVLCTFGLISRGKGIEYAIQALPSIVAKHPEVLYLIIGETHPEVKKSEDETYRKSLIALVDELGMQKHVQFQNCFLPKSELMKYLQATDVYITPYLGKNQISSGTLIYALGTGRVVVSTPYLHAQEVLADGRGLFCEFKSPSSIAKMINKLLANKSLKRKIEKKAYEYSRSFTWFEVAKEYAKLFNQVIEDDKEEEAIEISARNT
jgi:glycosyltransferase involved in cell wall biosynthesis